MAQISAELRSIREEIKAQNDLYDERRKVDDKRAEAAETMRREMLDRIDGHGGRLRTLEVRWEAFFAPEGAFQTVLANVRALTRISNWNQKMLFIGMGIIMALDFLLLHGVHF